MRSSRLAARVDNNAIADGFQLYLHGFIIAASGEWTIVQQGMNGSSGMARRYHWHSAAVKNFINEPHIGIVDKHQGTIMNLVAASAAPAQQSLLYSETKTLKDLNPKVLEQIQEFFVNYQKVRGIEVRILGHAGPRVALQILATAGEGKKAA